MHRMTVRRSAALLLAAALIAVAAVLVPAAVAGSSSNGPPQLRVYGGGNVPIDSCSDGATPFCTHVTREYSIFAVRDPNEGITYGTITAGAPELGGVRSVIRVTCLAVSGNVVEVGGVITYDPNPAMIGGPYNLFIRDSGQPGTVERDGISPSFIDVPNSTLKPNCNDASSDAFDDGFFNVTYGDFAIQKVTNQNG